MKTNIPPLILDGHYAMMLAATLGGMAFSNSSVALVHGMSRPIGAVFHLPHGLSNAVLLPAVTAYSIPAAPERYAAVACVVGCAHADMPSTDACGALLAWLELLNLDLEIPRLSQCPGVTSDLFETSLVKMAEDALASGSPTNNPAIPDAGEIVRLYREAW